jgi:hypothetical protein
MTAPRLALIGAIAATLLLAGCSAPSTPDPADTPDPTTAPEPTVTAISDLDFPNGLTEWLGPLDTHKGELAAWHAQFGADCSAEMAGSADSPDCTEAMLTGLKAVNAIKTDFDFNIGDADWDSGEYSGVEALKSTHDAILTASGSGSDFIDTCYYVPGGDGSGACVGTAQAFLDDVDGVMAELATWEL